MKLPYFIFQVFVGERPLRKHFSHCATGSGRMLGVKRNFRKYAEKYGFTESVNDEKSYLEYSFKNEAGELMSLRFVEEIEK